ncbi:MAG TPA: glycosyltransferase family 2 protein [Gemmataceae bacterium]|nr:glycosyltransferase family 2 protein [Gemmataceae bacterium]
MPELPELTPIASQPLSVVLLTRNQAGHLEALLAAWVTYLNGLDREYELIVVDDGSTDGTSELAEKLAAGYRRVLVRRHERAQGEGAALRTALTLAQHPLLCYTLGDPHYVPADLGKLLRKRTDSSKPDLEIDHVHLLSASRGGQSVPWAWQALGVWWRLLNRVLFAYFPQPLPGWLGWKRHALSFLVRVLFGVRYHDVACPFRLLRREIFARIPLQSDGAFVHVEILAKANYLGMMMGEQVPLEPGRYPPLTTEMSREERRQLHTDACRVLRHPTFTAYGLAEER